MRVDVSFILGFPLAARKPNYKRLRWDLPPPPKKKLDTHALKYYFLIIVECL